MNGFTIKGESMIEYIRTIPYMLTHKRIDEEKLDIVRIKILRKKLL